MVQSIDDPRPGDEHPQLAAKAADSPAEVRRTEPGASDPYAEMELKRRHERTERSIRKARDLT